MELNEFDVTSLSSKGQVVLPKSIREKLSLKSGAKLIIFSDGKNILLKPIASQNVDEFNSLIKKMQNWAKEVGLRESEINEAISEVRKRK